MSDRPRVYWYDQERGKVWPFDGTHSGDGNLIKLVDPSVMPEEFVCIWDESNAKVKFKRNDNGTYDQWEWMEWRWTWDDNVGADTAFTYFSDPATLIAVIR